MSPSTFVTLYSNDLSRSGTVWGGRLRKRFCNMLSESSTGIWAELQLPCCPSKQGELLANLLQNLRNKWPPPPVRFLTTDISWGGRLRVAYVHSCGGGAGLGDGRGHLLPGDMLQVGELATVYPAYEATIWGLYEENINVLTKLCAKCCLVLIQSVN